MSAKVFVVVLIGVLLLGGGFGGAFLGGYALGESQEGEMDQSSTPAQTSPTGGQLAQGPSSGQTPDQLRARVQSGEASQEEMEQLRQQFKGQRGAGSGGVGFAGPTGLTGTIESVEGNTVTVNTSQGVLHVTIGEDTTIQETVEVSPADLLVGLRVTINGALGEGGTVEATTVVVIPE